MRTMDSGAARAVVMFSSLAWEEFRRMGAPSPGATPSNSPDQRRRLRHSFGQLAMAPVDQWVFPIHGG
jgi:hypothetical protein